MISLFFKRRGWPSEAFQLLPRYRTIDVAVPCRSSDESHPDAAPLTGRPYECTPPVTAGTACLRTESAPGPQAALSIAGFSLAVVRVSSESVDDSTLDVGWSGNALVWCVGAGACFFRRSNRFLRSSSQTTSLAVVFLRLWMNQLGQMSCQMRGTDAPACQNDGHRVVPKTRLVDDVVLSRLLPSAVWLAPTLRWPPSRCMLLRLRILTTTLYTS